MLLVLVFSWAPSFYAPLALLLTLLLLFILLFASTYRVREWEQVVITQFGEPVGVVRGVPLLVVGLGEELHRSRVAALDGRQRGLLASHQRKGKQQRRTSGPSMRGAIIAVSPSGRKRSNASAYPLATIVSGDPIYVLGHFRSLEERDHHRKKKSVDTGLSSH